MKERYVCNGFSLVELSIVLVILGLLVGGVLSGQSLIRAAQLRAVTTEYKRYYAATQSFRDKYFALPGDMTNATSFWGIAGGTGSDATCQTTVSTDARTCNGNGDGTVTFSTGSYEYFRFWQHLAAAGLIEGTYTGMTSGANLYAPGVNIPVTKLGSNIGWFVYTDATVSGHAFFFDGTNRGRFSVLIPNAAAPYGSYGTMSPTDTWNIDTKMDDGKPATGSVVSTWGSAFSQSGTSCTTAASGADLTAIYVLTNNNTDCTPIFRYQF